MNRNFLVTEIKKIFTWIKEEISSHSFDYLLLLTGGVFFLIGLRLFRGERLIEFIFLVIFTSFYIIWGVYHHVINNSLRLKIVLEYVLIGFISLFLLKMIFIP